MKKLIYCAAALATALFAGSCQQEMLDTTAVETTVTYTVALPEAQTKAIGDAENVDELIYEVWVTEAADERDLTGKDANGKDKATRLYQSTASMVGGRTNITLNLVQDQEYTILFWAQKEGAGIYTTNDLTSVSYAKPLVGGEEGYKSNDETHAAFYGIDFVSDSDPKSKKVTLKRPFAQLNIATLNTPNPSTEYKVEVLESKVVVANVGTIFNVAQNYVATPERVAQIAVGGASEVTFDYAPDPSGDNEYLFINGEESDYEHVAMNYLFATGNNVTVSYEIKAKLIGTDAQGKGTEDEAIISNTVYEVPLQENYRTNIIGNLLTSTTQYEVVIDAEFNTPDMFEEAWNGTDLTQPKASTENPNIYEIEYPSELAWLAAAVNGTLPETRAVVPANDFAGKTFKLTKNIDLAGHYWTPIGSNGKIFKGTFDGDGHTVKNLLITGNNSNVGLFGVTHDGEIKNLIVEDAKVSGRLNVGVVAGQPYTSKYTNITVKGHIEVNGMAYVGGVGGKNAYADWTGITVDVDETSYVKANSVENGTAYRTYVGGVVGFNGEGGHKFTNITSDINVEGSTCDVGGLFGIAHYGNQFENCSCTGNVTITTDEVENAFEMGGIAGVWHNGGENVVFTKCSFTGELSTPNITEEVEFYYGGLIGNPYSATGNGKLIIDGKQYVATAAQLQAAIKAAEGETTLYLGYDIVGDVTVVQKAGVKITIEGENHKFNGSIKVHSNSNYYADAALTIKNVNFETSAASINCIEALENGSERYSQNITVENCTFTATGEAVKTSVAVQVKATRGVTVTGCTATDMHSLIQAQSCDTGDVMVVGCTVNGKNGVAFKQVKSATVEGTTITALEYGIRFDGNIDNYGIVVKNNNVTANQPLIVRKMTGKNNTITLEGTNTLTTEAEYQIVITNGSDDEAYVKPTGTYTLTGADAYTIFPAPFPVASWDEFTAALAAGEENIKLTADITYDANSLLSGEIFTIK